MVFLLKIPCFMKYAYCYSFVLEVYEVDFLIYPESGSEMNVLVVITDPGGYKHPQVGCLTESKGFPSVRAVGN
jgi:hypothetical protein